MEFPACLPAIAQPLGDSVVAEEYRGDFAAARAAAEQALDSAQAGGDPLALADALLSRGVVHLLQCESARAVACFEHEAHTACRDPGRELLSVAYALLAREQGLSVFPGWVAAATLECGARYDRPAVLEAVEARSLPLRAKVTDPAFALHADLLNDLLFLLPIGRSILAGSAVASPEQRRSHAEMVLGRPLSFAQRAAASGSPALAASAYLASADLLWRAGERAPAVQLLEQVRSGFDAGGDAAGAAACWLRYGDWLSAPDGSPLTWGLRAQDGDWSHALSWITEQREFERTGSRAGEARDAYARAGDLYARADSRRGSAAVSIREGWLAVLAGDHSAAQAHARAAESGFAAAGDRAGAVLALAHAALAAVGTSSRAGEEGAAARIGAWGRTEGSFAFASGIGVFFARCGRRWLAHEGDGERGLACFRLAETLFGALSDDDGVAQSLADQGTAHAAVGEHAAAAVVLERAYAGYRALVGARPAYALAAWQKAVLTLDELWRVAQGVHDPEALERRTAALVELSRSPPPAGDGPDLFTPEFVDVLPGLVESRVEVAATVAPMFRALQAREAGDQEAVARHAEAALRAAGAAAPERRDFLEAQAYRLANRRAEATAAFARFLEAGGADAGALGELARRMAGQFSEAGAAVEADRPLQSHRMAVLFFCSVRDWQQAAEHLRALESARGDAWWAREAEPWDVQRCYGEVYEGLNELERALGHYERGMDELEARWVLLSRDEARVAMTGGTAPRNLYFGAARAALRAVQAALPGERPASAARLFRHAERGRARSLLELLAQDAAPSGAGRELREAAARLSLSRQLLAREHLRERPDPLRVQDLSRRIEVEERRLRQIEAREAEPGGFLRGRVLSVEETAGHLPEGTALLQYAFLGSDLLCWAVTRGGLAEAHLGSCDARALGAEIRAFHRACAGRGATGAAGARLASVFLDPLRDTLRASARLVVVPYGPAHLLPFHVLPWEGAPFGATRSLSYLPSASTLQFLRRDGPLRADRALAVGNPEGMVYRPPGGGGEVALQPLPGAEAEAAYVASLFPQGRALLGPAATGEALRAGIAGCPVIHLATHGYLSAEAPLLSALLLADGDELSVHELMGLRLEADLVVLSACETGRGEGTGGEEVLGLTRGLLAAGARAAVVSLWPVDDLSTGVLMGEFHRRVRAGVPKADALREAQAFLRRLDADGLAAEVARMAAALESHGGGERSLARLHESAARHLVTGGVPGPPASRYDHPYYWAPFVLVGAP